MAITRLRVAGYRSLRRCSVELSRLTVVVGPNGCGKTNLYRAMLLLASAARGEFARQIVGEGGMRSALWAGERRKGPVRLTLGAALAELEYELSAGLPPIEKPDDGPPPLFLLDPCVKAETIRARTGHRPVEMLNRKGGTIWARDASGKRVTYPFAINPWETVLGELSEPHAYPEIGGVRQELLGWRFYHGFRTDADSPLRQAQVGTRTPVLSHDGFDLTAALATILDMGDYRALHAALDDAFPGAALSVDLIGIPDGRGLIPPGNRLELSLWEHGFGRPFSALELSDGTLRYLCLLAALLSPRPPALLALNEPETSIHPRLIEPLGRLIATAAERSQVWVTTHSEALAVQLARASGAEPIRLEKVGGETRVAQPDDDGWEPAEDEQA